MVSTENNTEGFCIKTLKSLEKCGKERKVYENFYYKDDKVTVVELTVWVAKKSLSSNRPECCILSVF